MGSHSADFGDLETTADHKSSSAPKSPKNYESNTASPRTLEEERQAESEKSQNSHATLESKNLSLRGGGKATNEAIHKDKLDSSVQVESSAKVDSKETSPSGERYPLFSKEATLCHADKSARNDRKNYPCEKLDSSTNAPSLSSRADEIGVAIHNSAQAESNAINSAHKVRNLESVVGGLGGVRGDKGGDFAIQAPLSPLQKNSLQTKLESSESEKKVESLESKKLDSNMDCRATATALARNDRTAQNLGEPESPTPNPNDSKSCGGAVVALRSFWGRSYLSGNDYSQNERNQSHCSLKTESRQKPYSNFHLQDIFGNFHRFFRPYTYRFRALVVRLYPQGYCYSDDSEIVITKHNRAIISQTSYPTHAFALPRGASQARKILESIKQLKLWARFYYQRLFKLHRVNGSLALLHQATNYYHFLSESIAALEQIRRSGIEPDYYLLDQSMPYQRQMWQILQIPESKILPLKPRRLIQAQTLIVPTFIANFESVEWRDGITHHRTLALPLLLKQFYQHFATLLPKHTDSQPQTARKKRKIFLTRPSNSNRHLQNAKEVESIFAHFGYEIVLPDDLSLESQARMTRESSIMASLHGAGLSNAFFMRQGAIVFEIFPQYYHYSCPQMCALLMGCRYFYMVAQTPDTTPHPQQESARVCAEQLQKALQKLESYL